MITAGLCDAYKLDCQNGVHQPDDEYRIALYGETAALSPATVAYTPQGEVSGQGYKAGGQPMKGRVSGVHAGVGWVSWKDSPRWNDATIKAHGALLYNASKGNRAMAVYSFGECVTSTNGPFVVPLPAPSADTALLRVL